MRPAPSARSLFVFVALAALGGGLAGCKPGSALHNRYNNFRAYYNTYYNATRSLEDGERSLERGDTPVDRNVLVSVFPATPASGGSGGPFQEAIDKSAELLRNRPTSKWADDALLVIGKAYFYQRNFVGAEQKFRETLAAAALTGDRRLGDEARFWLGRTFASADRYDDGVTTLEEGLVAEGGDRRWTSRMRLALGELYARAGRWEEAAAALREGAPEVGEADLAARAYMLLGQVEEQADHFDAAAEAYEAALGERPTYELAFAAEVNRALVLGLDAERPEEGLDVVDGMLGDDKHYQRRGELALVRARLLAAGDRLGEAESQFLDVLYDEELAANAVRAQAHYRLGEFYRDARSDYIRASAHFDTAATGYREPPSTERASRGAIRDLPDEAQAYNALATAAQGVAEADSLLALGALSPEAFEAWRERIEDERRRVFQEEQRRLQAQREQQAFAGEGGPDVRGQSAAEQATTQAAAGGQIQGAGFLNYRNPTAIQAGYVGFSQRWGDRPLVPEWRREAAVRASAVASDVGRGELGTNNPFAFGEGPPPLDLTAVPRTAAAREEMITELAGLRYELANAFFLSLGRADTAAALYRSILADTPDLPAATRARYALGEIELEAGRAEAARPYYEAVIEAAPDSPLAVSARARLSRNAVAETVSPDVETSAAYDAARRRWQEGEPREAAADLLALADADPESPLAPRTYLGVAAAYAEWVMPDTLALAGPMPGTLVSPVLLDAVRGLDPPASERAPVVRPADPEAARGSEAGPDPEVVPIDEGEADGEPAEVPLDPDNLRVDIDEAETRGRPPGKPLPMDDDEIRRPTPVAGGRRALALEGAEEQLASESLPEAAERPEPVAGPPMRAATDTTTFTLHDHLRALAALYPDTEAARRAQAMLTALPPRWVPADTVAVDTSGIGADSLFAFSDLPPSDPEAADSTDSVQPPDSTASVTPLEVPGLRGEDPLDPASGGVTWRVRTLSIASEGEVTRRVLQDAGFRAAVAREEATGAFALLLGQFATEAEAEGVRTALPAWAQARGEIVALDRFTLIEPPPDPRDEF